MKILMVGGGSGGHVLPIKALIEEIIKEQPQVEIIFWTDRKFFGLSKEIIGKSFPKVEIKWVFSGKLRRYNKSRISLREFFLNIRDAALLGIGFSQSLMLLLMERPDVVFVKGGYVGLPVGMAAKMSGIPAIVHDSDSVLGLTNKILGRFAKKIAVSWPIDGFPGRLKKKMVFTGVPVADDVVKSQNANRKKLKKKLGFDVDRPLVLAVGGGLGARSINLAMVENLGKLLKKYSVALISGQKQFDEIRKTLDGLTDEKMEITDSKKFQLFDFVPSGLGELMAAADVVVARAGATTIAELAILKKAAILVPAEFLTGGHQSKNAFILLKNKAVLRLTDGELSEKLVEKVDKILDDEDLKKSLETNISGFATPNATRNLAELVLEVANPKKKHK